MSPELTPEYLRTLMGEIGSHKFVRQGKRIAVESSEVEHEQIAQRYRMGAPDDAGRLKQEDENSLSVVDGSYTLDIDDNNPGRPKTIELVKKMASKANIEIVE